MSTPTYRWAGEGRMATVIEGGDPHGKPLPARLPCPECRDGKHDNCAGQAWDFDRDQPVPCSCEEAGHP